MMGDYPGASVFYGMGKCCSVKDSLLARSHYPLEVENLRNLE
jgi:hypothetical protein